MTDQAGNRGRFVKGAPSPNPLGRGAAIAKAKHAPGYDGVVAFSGYVTQGENDSRLQGSQRWKTFANLWRQCPPLPIWARLRDRLLSGVTWSLVPNEAGMNGSATERAAAERGVEIVTEALLKARLGRGAAVRPWSKVAARAMNGAAAVGYSLHATAFGRRKRDGLVVYTDIAHRPQHTIDRWFRERDDDETTPFARVEQRTTSGRTVQLALVDCLYVVNDNGTNSESPMGVGMLELVAERARQLDVYEKIIGAEISSSMGGIPIARVPLEEMKQTLRGAFKLSGSALASAISTALAAKTQPIRDFLAKRFKDPTLLQWLELDSATYQGSDPNTISTTYKWGVEIVKGDLQGVTETRPMTRDFIMDIARMLGVEHVFVGGGDTAGTFGMHESKITALGADLSSEARLFAAVADDQVVRPIVAANGLDPDIAAPSLQPSPIMRTDVLKAVQAIAQLGLAGLVPNHPAKKAVFEAVDLPWQDEDESDLLLPRGTPPGGEDDDEGEGDEGDENEGGEGGDDGPEPIPPGEREREERPE